MQIRMPKLFPAQRTIRNSRARFKVVAAGRRFGKTRLGVACCVETAALGKRAWWVAPSFPMAEPGWRGLKLLAEQLGDKAQIRESERRVELSGGGEIRVRSADDPQSLRGESLDFVVLDECAYMKEATWYEVLRPSLSDRKGGALIISTPRLGDVFFRKLYSHGVDPAYTAWQAFSYPTSANPTIDPKEIEEARATMRQATFEMEYLAQFPEVGGGVFQGIGKVAVLETASPQAGHRYVAGLDFARYEDFTVLSMFDCMTSQQVDLMRFTGLPWEIQRQKILERCKAWNVALVEAEANSIGGPNIEALRNQGLNVEAFTTTAQSKVAIIDSLALSIERTGLGVANEIGLLNDPVQKHEFECFTVQDTVGGFRYAAPSGEHDDTVMAAALGWYATKRSAVNIAFA